ncbi:MAG: hypothetical protein BGP12_19765 [Rhodospirillales bacterium 70-18]|nr:MAG: hypothetical protein BGP12_19765 [Rhodospirillales bacterium 70-18]
MSYKSWVVGVVLAGAALLGVTAPAQATVLTLDQVSNPSYTAPSDPTLQVGDLLFTLDYCSGVCTSNVQVVGVPASPSTGPGGGIALVPVSGQSILSGAANEISLTWWVDVVGGANKITGVSGSVAGTGSAAGGGVNINVGGTATHLGTVTVSLGDPAALTLAALQNALDFSGDFTIGTGSTMGQATVFVSELSDNTNSSDVPEPASVAVVLMGVLGLAGARRRAAS